MDARNEVEALGGASGGVALELENAPKLAEHLGKTIPEYLSDLAAHNIHRAELMREQANVTVGGAK